MPLFSACADASCAAIASISVNARGLRRRPASGGRSLRMSCPRHAPGAGRSDSGSQTFSATGNANRGGMTPTTSVGMPLTRTTRPTAAGIRLELGLPDPVTDEHHRRRAGPLVRRVEVAAARRAPRAADVSVFAVIRDAAVAIGADALAGRRPPIASETPHSSLNTCCRSRQST